MKNLITGVFLIVFAFSVNAQDATVKTVSLEQTKGEFTQKSMTLSEGTYVFNVTNTDAAPEEGFGIRLEDDVVIQEKGTPFNLMRNIPIEVEEIEDIMNKA